MPNNLRNGRPKVVSAGRKPDINKLERRVAATLYLDIGNSACKWRLVDGQTRRQGSCSRQDHWQAILKQIPETRPDQVHIASVAGQNANQQLQSDIERHWQLIPQFYKSTKAGLGVTNAYDEPARLGVDRWLCVLEAYHRYGASIVIDCGSAITIDAVAADGRHLGGYIVPGLRLLKDSLLQGTAEVCPAEVPLQRIDLGRDTASAVGNGALCMVADFICARVVALQQQLTDTCTCVATGGDLAYILPHLAMTVRQVDGLVLDGLERIAARHE